MMVKMESTLFLCMCFGMFVAALPTKEHISWPMIWANHHQGKQMPNLPDLLQTEGESTLLEYLVKTKLDKALEATGPFTVFGPTNKAFSDLPPGLANVLKHNLTLLANVLKYHVLVNNAVYSSQLSNEMLVPTLNGGNVRVNIYGDTQKIITIDGSVVSKPDLNASNGVLHEIEKVMLPPVGNLITSIKGCPKITTLVKAVEKADLVNTLSGPGPFTLFVPMDSAFDKIPASDLDVLLNNKTALTNVLTYHVVPATLYSAGLSDGPVKTVNGQDVTITKTEKGVTVNDANVIVADVSATNGVAHAIDTVLMPKGMTFHDMIFQPSHEFRRWIRL